MIAFLFLIVGAACGVMAVISLAKRWRGRDGVVTGMGVAFAVIALAAFNWPFFAVVGAALPGLIAAFVGWTFGAGVVYVIGAIIVAAMPREG